MCSALDKTWAKWLSPICTLQWAATGQLVADLWLQAAQVCVLCVVHYITTVTRLQPAAHAGLWYRVPKVWPSIHKQQSRWIHSGTHGTLYAPCKANTSMWIYTSHTHTHTFPTDEHTRLSALLPDCLLIYCWASHPPLHSVYRVWRFYTPNSTPALEFFPPQ